MGLTKTTHARTVRRKTVAPKVAPKAAPKAVKAPPVVAPVAEPPAVEPIATLEPGTLRVRLMDGDEKDEHTRLTMPEFGRRPSLTHDGNVYVASRRLLNGDWIYRWDRRG